MNTLEITLIVLGIGVIIVSFFIDKIWKNPMKRKESSENKHNNEDMEKSLDEFKKQMEDSINRQIDEKIFNYHKEIQQLSNEKIIGIQECSDQILNDINSNREEVLFLYEMLKEKEREIQVQSLQQNVEQTSIQDRQHNVEQTSIQDQQHNVEQTSQQIRAVENDQSKVEVYKQIINLHKQGESIRNISKLLGLGQGEVKLIINLDKAR